MADRATHAPPGNSAHPAGDAVKLAETLFHAADEIGVVAARRYLADNPDHRSARDPAAGRRCADDMSNHLRHGAAAIATGRDELFLAYCAWAHEMLKAQGPSTGNLATELQHAVTSAGKQLGPAAQAGLDRLAHLALRDREVSDAGAADRPDRPAVASLLDRSTAAGQLAHTVLKALLAGDRAHGLALITAAADDGMDLSTIYLDVFQPALWELGVLWQARRITVAQEHLVSAAIQVAMAQLLPRAVRMPRNGRVAIVASMEGEFHEIGARMFADLLESSGWITHYVGANTPTLSLVDLAVTHHADLVAISVTLSSNITGLFRIIAAVRAATTASVLVGGRPFLAVPDLWRTVGADGTASEAQAAVEVAQRLTAAA